MASLDSWPAERWHFMTSGEVVLPSGYNLEVFISLGAVRLWDAVSRPFQLSSIVLWCNSLWSTFDNQVVKPTAEEENGTEAVGHLWFLDGSLAPCVPLLIVVRVKQHGSDVASGCHWRCVASLRRCMPAELSSFAVLDCPTCAQLPFATYLSKTLHSATP
eukprot:4063706-Amphidinium_carterae.1